MGLQKGNEMTSVASYGRRLQDKICVSCRNPVENTSKCRECLKRDREKRAKLKQLRVQAKQCTKCGDPLTEERLSQDRVKCKSCCEKWNKYERHYRRLRRMLQLCTRCGCETIGSRLCRSCSRKANKRRMLHYAENEGSYEMDCKRNLDRYYHRKSLGLCSSCPNPATSGRTKCGPCRDRVNALARKLRSI
jgi:hypothetical protein